ncbi:MAG: DUF2220 family protein [Holophaga sp.]|nr:DUF2220 family protein [Holophaga sp.]
MIPSLDSLRARAMRHWSGCDYHREVLAGRTWQPWVVPFGSPSGQAALDGFSALRAALERLREQDGIAFRLEWATVRYQKLGPQQLPCAASFDFEEGFLAFIGKTEEAGMFKALVQETLDRLPGLRPFLDRKPMAPLSFAVVWTRLLRVAEWFLGHPRPGIYLRQIDLPGIDSKFIEGHKGILTDLLNALLPSEAIHEAATGLSQHGFEKRFGLAFEPPQVRFRILDPALATLGLDDLTVPVAQFATLRLPVRRVFLTENKVNGLAFPPMTAAIVIFGLGYGLELLSQADWLRAVELYYWGDLDTHGMAMLARLRRRFPAVRSLLMDSATLMADPGLWGEEPAPVSVDIDGLTGEESAALAILRQEGGGQLRLEQERIPFHLLEAALLMLPRS